MNSNHGNDVLIILRSLDESNERKNLFKNKINKFSYLMKRDQRWLVIRKSINTEMIMECISYNSIMPLFIKQKHERNN